MMMRDFRDLQLKIIEFRERDILEGMLEALETNNQQVENEIKDLAEIAKYKVELAQELQENFNN